MLQAQGIIPHDLKSTAAPRSRSSSSAHSGPPAKRARRGASTANEGGQGPNTKPELDDDELGALMVSIRICAATYRG